MQYLERRITPFGPARCATPTPNPSSLRCGLQPFGCIERGVDNALIAGAAAQVAGDGDAHLLLGRVRIVAQELDERRQHAGRAEAALEAVIVAERLLQR